MLNLRDKYQKMPRVALFPLLVAALVAAASACGKKSSKKSVIDPPQRSGTAFVSYSLKYTDENPSFNSDGTRLVFISGRDSEESNAVFKAYKLSWTSGQAPEATAAARVTSADLGRETAAAISPDGKWIAVSAASGAENAIYVQSYDEAGGERLVKKSSDRISGLAFSPDSRMLMWLASTQDGVRVEMADVGVVATDAVSAVQNIAAVTLAASAVWIPGGTGYNVAVAESGVAAGASTSINRYQFSTLADLPTVTAEKILDAQQFDKSVPMSANTSTVGFVSIVPPSSKVLVPRFGKAEDPQPTIPMKRQPQWAATSAGATAESGESFAYETSQIALGTDNTAFFALNKVYYACEGDETASFGSDFVVLNSGDKSFDRMAPRVKADGSGFEMAADLCDNLDANGARRRMDNRATEIAVNSAATGAVFRMAYVTRTSKFFDASCGLKLGDPDIYLVEGTASGKTIYHLSGNQVPLESDPLPEGAEPCAL
jgi:hypothetical protein